MWINHLGWGIECSQIMPTDENKIYIFKGNSCVEQYKSCEAYQNSGNTIDKNTCELIIIKEDYKKKCLFNEWSNTCTVIDRKCSDFKVDSIENLCYNYSLSSDSQKCSYSNNFCSMIIKPTCLELFNSRTATGEICNKVKTSSDKKFVLWKVIIQDVKNLIIQPHLLHKYHKWKCRKVFGYIYFFSVYFAMSFDLINNLDSKFKFKKYIIWINY